MSELISRQAVIEALGEEPLVWNDTSEELALREQWRSHVEAIKALPTGWIPVSEKTLLLNKEVLCVDNRGNYVIGWIYEDEVNSDTGYSAESEECIMYNCVAWMPLPEPYKGEEE